MRRLAETALVATALSCVPPAPIPQWQPAGRVPTTIDFNNAMSSDFELTGIRVLLDGRLLYSGSEESANEAAQEYAVALYAGPVPSGDHVIFVELNYKGAGEGTGFKFVVRSSHSFQAIEGRSTSVAFTAVEKPGVPYWRRPIVVWRDSASDTKATPEDWQPTGSYPCAISFNNRMARDFRLLNVSFSLDGKRLYAQPAIVSIVRVSEDVEFYNGPVPLGKHVLSVTISYEELRSGNLKGFTFSLKSDHSFTPVEGKATRLRFTVLDLSEQDMRLEWRPHAEWNEQIVPARTVGASR
jgi:hypothetical protein